MPPKKQPGGNKKQQAEKVKKIVEDKTFGMKNKNKSAKVQKYVQEVKSQAMSSGKRREEPVGPTKKELEAQRKAELAEIFKPVHVQKVPFGVDPKTVLCSFFKQGLCQKGSKCKFSHDLNVERKGAKIDVYTDKRDQDKENDTMDTWDQSKLETVVLSKHGNLRTTTNIVCKHFLEAIENNKYGWFWVCPNGGDQCKYRHALPDGYVLQQNRRKVEEEVSTITLEEFLETERHNLGTNLTPVTLETFMSWKQQQLDKAAEAEAVSNKAKEAQIKAGRKQGLSGRDLFTFDPSQIRDVHDDLVGDDGYAIDLGQYLYANRESDRQTEEEARRQAEDARMAANNMNDSTWSMIENEPAVESSSEALALGFEALALEDVLDEER